MAIVFLQAINATLKRVGEIAGDSEELATSTVTSTATGLVATDAFTDSRRQHKIDVAIQLWNEAIHFAYSMNLAAAVASTATISLADGSREYDLPSDFERMAGAGYEDRVIRGATTGLIVTEYPGGYARMLARQPVASDYRGDPNHWALSPVGNAIRFDTEQTSDQDGQTYNFLYEKRISLSSTMATSTLPFSDTVADAILPVVAESYHRVFKKEFDRQTMQDALAISLAFMTQNQPRNRYGKRRI